MIAYLDESGDFDNVSDIVAVGGIGFREPVANGLLKRALERLCPGWPWPLHAAHLRVPISLALASATARRIDPTVRTPVDADADAAFAALRARPSDGDLLETSLQAMESGQLPKFVDVARLTVALNAAVRFGRLSSEVTTRLEIARDVWARAMSEIMGALPGVWGIATLEDRCGCAGDSYFNRAQLSHAVTPSATHRYFGLLGPALVAAESVATHNAVSGLSAARVASRWVHDARGLNDDDLGHVARMHGCRTKDLRVVRYDRHAPVMLVLADFVANSARRTAVAGSPRYIDVLSATTGLTFESGTATSPVSHVVTVGAPAS
jgi:hypothetical protein